MFDIFNQIMQLKIKFLFVKKKKNQTKNNTMDQT